MKTQVWLTGFILASALLAQPHAAHEESLRLIDAGKYAEARAHAALAFERMRSTAKPCELAGLLFDQGTAEQLLTQYQNAAATFARAQELCRAPKFQAAVLAALGEAHAALGMFAEASRELRSAVEIAQSLPSADERLARVHESLGVLALRQGNQSNAERHLRQSIEFFEAALGSAHSDAATVELTLVGVLISQNRIAEALPLAESARRKLLALHGSSHPDSIFASLTAGIAMTQTTPALAESLLRQTLAAWPEHLPQHHLTVMHLWNAIGTAQRVQGHAGAESIARALEIARAVTGPESEETMRTLYAYAQSLKAERRKKDAAAVLADARRIQRSKGYSDPGLYTTSIRSLQRRK